MGKYRNAEICLNGHPTTSDFEHSGERASPYCSKCGAQTIRKCPACKLFIRGRYHIEGGFLGGGKYQAPAYCHLCGNAYPWTETALHSAKELVEELDQLNRDEKDKLNGSIEELVRNSPKAQVAAVRFKNLMEKAGGIAADAMGGILGNVVSEAIKKLIF